MPGRGVHDVKGRRVLALGCLVCFLVAPDTGAAASAAAATAAGALDLLSSKDASAGLKAALSQSVNRAVQQLGVADGFLSNPKVTIPLPSAFRDIEPALRLLGHGGDADDLKASLNHAAEAAVSEAAPILKKSLRNMTLADAKGILGGGEDSATQFFRRSAGEAAQYGLLGGSETNMNDYVTDKALDGLFIVMADEERAIRKDPLGQASAIIRKVFGAQ